jgi:hypothetical protein
MLKDFQNSRTLDLSAPSSETGPFRAAPFVVDATQSSAMLPDADAMIALK